MEEEPPGIAHWEVTGGQHIFYRRITQDVREAKAGIIYTKDAKQFQN